MIVGAEVTRFFVLSQKLVFSEDGSADRGRTYDRFVDHLLPELVQMAE